MCNLIRVVQNDVNDNRNSRAKLAKMKAWESAVRYAELVCCLEFGGDRYLGPENVLHLRE